MKPVTSLVIACVITALNAGILFGWQAAVLLLTDSGVFSEGCVSKNGTKIGPCASRDDKFQLIFTIASSLSLTCPLLWGHLLDTWGPKKTVSLCLFLVGTGLLLVSLGTARSEAMYFFAFSLIGSGGPAIQNSLISVSNLFPGKEKFVTAILVGCFQLSTGCWQILETVSHVGGGITVNTLFAFHAFLSFVCIIVVQIFVPNEPYCVLSSDTNVEDIKLLETNADDEDVAQPDSADDTLRGLPFLRQLTHPLFIASSTMSGIFFFWVNGYLAMVGSIIDSKAIDEGATKLQSDSLKRIFNIMCSGSALLTPLVGVILTKIPLTYGAVLQVLLGVGYAVCILLPMNAQVLTFSIWSFLSIYMYAFVYAFVADRFGSKHFGKLSGTLMLVMALSNLLNLVESGPEKGQYAEKVVYQIVTMSPFLFLGVIDKCTRGSPI